MSEQSPPPVQYSPDGRYYWDGWQWITVQPQPAAPPRQQPSGGLMRKLDFEFDVGEMERHRVRFTFDQTWGNVEITIDGRSAVSDLRLLSFSTTRRYQLVVGVQERHEVVIEKRRPLLLAGFRPQTARVFVDGRHLGDFTN